MNYNILITQQPFGFHSPRFYQMLKWNCHKSICYYIYINSLKIISNSFININTLPFILILWIEHHAPEGC